jgi:hypothetical protein
MGHLEHGCLGRGVLPEFIHRLHAPGLGLVLFSLTPALGFIPLPLLPGVLFLTLGER